MMYCVSLSVFCLVVSLVTFAFAVLGMVEVLIALRMIAACGAGAFLSLVAAAVILMMRKE